VSKPKVNKWGEFKCPWLDNDPEAEDGTCTVEELIAILQQCDPKATVYLEDTEYTHSVGKISLTYDYGEKLDEVIVNGKNVLLYIRGK
jgi:small nuclear ribonucleoprotein (snRNP)-like protein